MKIMITKNGILLIILVAVAWIGVFKLFMPHIDMNVMDESIISVPERYPRKSSQQDGQTICNEIMQRQKQKIRTCEEVIQFAHEDQVASVEYDPLSLQAVCFDILTVTLRDGSSFEAAPIRCILSEFRKCCEDIKIERLCGQDCL